MDDTPEVRTILADMVRGLVTEYAPEKVILFGSYASGEPGPDSDLDLLIIKRTSERFLDRLCRARRILAGEHQRLPLEVLVVTPQEIEERVASADQFFAEILEKGEILYAA